MENKENKQMFKKINVGLVILLTIITLGVYTGYWFLKERKTLKNIDTRKVIPIKLWWLFTVLLVISFLNNFFGVVFLTPYGLALFNSFDMIFSFYFLGLLYYSLFRMKELLEERYEDISFNPWLLVLFNVWYLQFKINRLEGNEHDQPKVKEVFAK